MPNHHKLKKIVKQAWFESVTIHSETPKFQNLDSNTQTLAPKSQNNSVYLKRIVWFQYFYVITWGFDDTIW